MTIVVRRLDCPGTIAAVDSQPIHAGQPTPYRAQVRGSRYV